MVLLMKWLHKLKRNNCKHAPYITKQLTKGDFAMIPNFSDENILILKWRKNEKKSFVKNIKDDIIDLLNNIDELSVNGKQVNM